MFRSVAVRSVASLTAQFWFSTSERHKNKSYKVVGKYLYCYWNREQVFSKLQTSSSKKNHNFVSILNVMYLFKQVCFFILTKPWPPWESKLFWGRISYSSVIQTHIIYVRNGTSLLSTPRSKHPWLFRAVNKYD